MSTEPLKPPRPASTILLLRDSADGRIYIELINAPFLFEHKGNPTEYKAGLDLAIDRGWLVLHESGTYVKFTQMGAEMFA
jgi:hypothetical protein